MNLKKSCVKHLDDIRTILGIVRQLFCDAKMASLRFILGASVMSVTEVASLGTLLPIIHQVTNEEGSEHKLIQVQKEVLKHLGMEYSLQSSLLLFFCINVISAGIFVLISYDMSRFVHDREIGLKERILSSLLASPWAVLCKVNHGEIQNGMTREADQTKTVYSSVMLLISYMINGVGLMIFLFYLSVPLALLGMAMAMAMTLLISPIVRAFNFCGQKLTTSSSVFSGAMINTNRSLKEIKACNLEEHSLTGLKNHIKVIAFWYKVTNGFFQPFRVRFYDLLGMVMLCILVFSAIETLELSGAALLLVMTTMLRLIPVLGQANNTFTAIIERLPSFDYLEKILDDTKPSAQTSRSLPETPVETLSTRKLGFCHEGTEQFLFKNLDTCFLRGEFWAICGPSGLGKTTLLDLLGGLLEATDGQVMVEDQLIQEIHRKDLCRHINYLPQHSYLFEGTLKENITWGVENITQDRVEEAVRMAQLDEFILDRGWDYRISESGQNLSGGQRQRVSLARAFCRGGDIILMDEPTASLDEKMEQAFLNDLQELKGQVGIIMITHRPEFLKHVDGVVRFHPNGEVEVLRN